MFDIQNNPLLQIVMIAKSSGNIQDAKTFLDIASKYAMDLNTLDQIAYLQSEVKDYDNSINTLNKAIHFTHHEQEQYNIRANLAKLYNHNNNPLDSIKTSEQNLEVSKKNNFIDFNTLMEISFSHYLYGDYKTSEKMMRELYQNKNIPDEIRNRIQYNIGSYDLENNKFQEGLKGFIDIGHKINIWRNELNPNLTIWNCDNQNQFNLNIIKEKEVYLFGEGGIGDELITFRFIFDLLKSGVNDITWISSHNSLIPIFKRIISDYTTVKIISNEEFNNQLIDYDRSIGILSMYLPIVLNIQPENLIDNIPYLTTNQDYVNKWKNKLDQIAIKLNIDNPNFISIKYAGNPFYDQDLHRSIEFNNFCKLNYPNNTIILDLQLEKEYSNNISKLPISGFWLGSEIESIEDTLAILSLCKYNITSCTSVAHMIGNLGLTGCVCPPIASYYTWLGNFKWYKNNFKVFRQNQHNIWDNVFENIQLEISSLCQTS